MKNTDVNVTKIMYMCKEHMTNRDTNLHEPPRLSAGVQEGLCPLQLASVRLAPAVKAVNPAVYITEHFFSAALAAFSATAPTK